jgi:hypothetical protein
VDDENQRIQVVAAYTCPLQGIYEDIVNVQLPHVSSLCHNEGEDNTYSGGLDDRAIPFIIVDVVPLLEAFGNEMRFVAIHSAIKSPLDIEDPVVIDDVKADKTPCVLFRWRA